jgi:hypothetical protein
VFAPFGDKENIPELINAYGDDSEDFGWAMTSVAAKILGSKGGYRCPESNGFIYLVLTDISFADKPRMSRQYINCDTHGQAYQAFICEHLMANPAKRWFSDDPTQENPWPDAWCNECETLLGEQGEWSDRGGSRLRIKLVCHRCYEQMRPGR